MLLKKCCLVAGVLAAMAIAEESPSLKISAWGWGTFGKVVSGYSEKYETPKFDVDFTGAWLTDFNAGVKIEKSFENTLKLRLNVGGGTVTQATEFNKPNREFFQRRFAFYVIDAAIERTFILDEQKSLFMEFGYLPVRFNPQAYNLGEYLFTRTTPYPAVVESGFELADKEKVVGYHIGYTMKVLNKSVIKIDNYLSSESKMWPIGDISEILTASANIEQFVDIGLGINFHHLFSVDKRQTTPGLDKVRSGGSFANYGYDDVTISGADTTHDTIFYTARGVKPVARITLNPRAFISSDALGPEDLKLYAEVAVLGWKNYPGWYENRNEREPLMFGFNIPTFKLLDVMSLQLQWFGSKYFNTWENMIRDGQITPYVKNNSANVTPEQWRTDSSDGKPMFKPIIDDDWKWSLYMSRKINNRVRLSLQFASDNMFKTRYVPGAPWGFVNYTEICRRTWAKDKKGKELFGQIYDWYWMGRIMFYL